eukprot:TRINITY_DN12848_c0_g5_i1.p1 TRINITY_DN12848_c0_g5~~TRINITY_DN12848_c0_g5_i1.p1  ORF type:complete len:235 (-),score=32.17 TRINITY_DN12848_c0_g5_i1:260-964(-)
MCIRDSYRDYEDDIRPFVSDDEDLPSDRHHLSSEAMKYAKEVLPRPQLYRAIHVQETPLPPMPVVSKPAEIAPDNEFLKQLHVPATYNNDLSSTKRGLEILRAVKSGSKNLLPEIMELYKLSFDSSIDSSGNTLAHICAAYNRADLIKHIQANGGSVACKNILGEQPLHIAAREGSFEVVNHLLIDPSINVNTTTNVISLLTIGRYHRYILLLHQFLEQIDGAFGVQQGSRREF